MHPPQHNTSNHPLVFLLRLADCLSGVVVAARVLPLALFVLRGGASTGTQTATTLTNQSVNGRRGTVPIRLSLPVQHGAIPTTTLGSHPLLLFHSLSEDFAIKFCSESSSLVHSRISFLPATTSFRSLGHHHQIVRRLSFSQNSQSVVLQN